MNAIDRLKSIQTILGVTADGQFGPKSEAALFSLKSASKTPSGPVPAPPTPPEPQAVSGEAVDARSEGNIKTLLPQVQPLARELVRKLVAAGIDAKIISGSRTWDEQNAIYSQGRTKPGNIVTNARGGQSWHNYGVAVDIGIFSDGKYLDDSPLYKKAGLIGEGLGFEWGGRWAGKLVDEPHLQYNPNRVSLSQAKVLHDQGKTILDT